MIYKLTVKRGQFLKRNLERMDWIGGKEFVDVIWNKSKD